MIDELEIRNLLREAGQVLIECADHTYSVTTPIHSGFGAWPDEEEETETKHYPTDGALKAQEMVKKIRKYLKDHINAEEEAIKRKKEADNYII